MDDAADTPATPASPATLLDADAAAALLGVRRATLYAYVSRGLLAAQPDPARRASRYLRSEVERLARERQASRRPHQAARQTLDWGLPVLRSALTLIDGGRLYYRGHDAVALSATATLESVAALLWGLDPLPPLDEANRGDARDELPATVADTATPLPAPAVVLAAFAARLPALSARCPEDSPPAAVAFALLQAMADALLGRDGSAVPAGAARPLHRQLQAAWRLDDAGAEHLRAALVLCADHELNASSFTARCVASTGAPLGTAVLAGLAALTGRRHGGMTERVEHWWAAWSAGAGVPAGRPPPGFGHPLYPQGDPRAAALLARLPADADRERLLDAVRRSSGLQPSVDLALVALRRALGLPCGAAFALFALGRTVGWLAHALEQQAEPAVIRPRAAYAGPRPADPAPSVAAGRIVRRR